LAGWCVLWVWGKISKPCQLLVLGIPHVVGS